MLFFPRARAYDSLYLDEFTGDFRNGFAAGRLLLDVAYSIQTD